VTDRVLGDLVRRRCGGDPVRLQAVFRHHLAATVDGAFPKDPPRSGIVTLGLHRGERLRLRVGAVLLRTPLPESSELIPASVTLVHRDRGSLRMAHQIRFGAPAHLRAAARAVGTSSSLGVDAIEGVVRELGRCLEPHAPVAALYEDPVLGWEAYRFLEVRHRVHDPDRHVALDRARTLEPTCGPGDLIGLSLPVQDWLTPLLSWMRGAG
jgi:hypothetical protein